jgi:hypothetical protein
MANIHVMQKMFSIVDQLAAIPKNIPRTFEGKRWTTHKWNGNNKCE